MAVGNKAHFIGVPQYTVQLEGELGFSYLLQAGRKVRVVPVDKSMADCFRARVQPKEPCDTGYISHSDYVQQLRKIRAVCGIIEKVEPPPMPNRFTHLAEELE